MFFTPVCDSVHRGGGHAWYEGRAWQGGIYVGGGMAGETATAADNVLRYILLECILVLSLALDYVELLFEFFS